MCGIVGLWTTKRDRIGPSIDAGCGSIVHRGPDQSGSFSEGDVALGMRRLAIVDLHSGDQPVYNESRSVAAVANGEIYGYQRLRAVLSAEGHQFRSAVDVEVIPHLYDKHGADLWANLPGMFAAAVYDRRERILLIGRDRLGKKPLFYHTAPDGSFYFGSELKALRAMLRFSNHSLDLDQKSLYDYVSLGYIPGPSTIFENVFSLLPGECATYDGERLRLNRYWRPTIGWTGPARDRNELVAETKSLLQRAVSDRLVADVPIGIFLSGGIDSSIVAAEAASLGANVQAFTASFSEASIDEAATAADTSQKLGIRHELVPISFDPVESLHKVVAHFDQPFADSSAVPSMAVAAAAGERVKVVLNGDGGDEVFCGYRRHIAALAGDKFRWVPKSEPLSRWLGNLANTDARRSMSGLVLRQLRGVFLQRGARRLAWAADMLQEREKKRVWLGEDCRPTEEWLDQVIPSSYRDFDQQRLFDIGVNLPWDLLVKVDMSCMSASIEPRSPFLDYQVVEFALGVPGTQHLDGWRSKSLLRDAYRTMVSDRVWSQPKKGFEVPLLEWLTNEFTCVMKDTLLASDSRLSQFLDSGHIASVAANVRSGAMNYPYQLYAYLVAELWLRQLKDN